MKKRMRSIKFFFIFGFAVVFSVTLLPAGGKKKPEEQAQIVGSVYREPGFALPEALVTLVREDDPKHKKLGQQSTTERGEFSFLVPATAAVYVVKASAKGYAPMEKQASVTGPDQINLTFLLEPEAKK